jgi:hypothetical protein
VPNEATNCRSAWLARLVAAAVVCGGGVGGLQAQEPAHPSLERAALALRQRDAVVEELANWISAEEAPPWGRPGEAEAALLLGRSRAAAGVPVLVQHIWLQHPPQKNPQDFPSVLAMGAIGLPAMPAFVEMLAKGGYGGESLSWPVTSIMSEMAPGRIVRASIERAADREPDAARSKRLRESASEIEGATMRGRLRAIGLASLARSFGGQWQFDPVIGKARGVADECDAAVKGLSDWLLSVDGLGDAEQDTQDAAVEAMELLGEFRLPEGIAGLAKHWDYVRRGARGDKLSDYPALTALAEIDFPALDALIGIAVEGKDKKAITWPLTEVFARLGPADAVAEVIEASAKREIDPDRYKWLMATAAAVREGKGEG